MIPPDGDALSVPQERAPATVAQYLSRAEQILGPNRAGLISILRALSENLGEGYTSGLGYRGIASKLGIHHRVVQRNLPKLEQVGLIERTERVRGNPTVPLYRLPLDTGLANRDYAKWAISNSRMQPSPNAGRLLCELTLCVDPATLSCRLNPIEIFASQAQMRVEKVELNLTRLADAGLITRNGDSVTLNVGGEA